MNWGNIITILIGGIPSVAAVLTIVFARRQNSATAEKTEIEAAILVKDASMSLLKPLQEKILDLTAELETLKKEVQETREENRKLKDELEAMSHPS